MLRKNSRINTKSQIILFLIIIILISGCKKDPGLKYPITNKEYQVGTQGLEFDFIPNAPPKSAYEETTFEIGTDVWNKGAYKITESYLNAIVDNTYMCILKSDGKTCATYNPSQQELIDQISTKKKERTILIQDKENKINNAGVNIDRVYTQEVTQINSQLNTLNSQIASLESQLMVLNTHITQDLISLYPSGEIIGRNIYYPEGTSRHVVFKAKAKKLDLLSVQHTSPIILNACYNYYTELSQDFCIDPDPTNKFEKVCKTEDITLSDQGAPVAITKIETRILPDNDDVKIQFLIYLKNKGTGEVLSRYKLKEACSSAKLRNEDWNKIILSEFGFSNNKYFYKYNRDDDKQNTISCEPNPLRLVDGKDFIKCTIDNNKLSEELQIKKLSPSYITQAYMRFDYGYTETNTQNIVIESTNS